MNEPKRRGRTPKALKQAIEDADAKNGERAASYAAALGYEHGHIRTSLHDIAQAYALRVWNGQSPDVPRNERIRRVKLALDGQNLPFEGVELP